MTELQEKVLEQILEINNKLYDRTKRGMADVVLVSSRIDNLFEDLQSHIHFTTIVKPSNWMHGGLHPDIRAIFYQGHFSMEYREPDAGPGEIPGIPEIDLSLETEEQEDVIEEYTFNNELFE